MSDDPGQHLLFTAPRMLCVCSVYCRRGIIQLRELIWATARELLVQSADVVLYFLLRSNHYIRQRLEHDGQVWIEHSLPLPLSGINGLLFRARTEHYCGAASESAKKRAHGDERTPSTSRTGKWQGAVASVVIMA